MSQVHHTQAQVPSDAIAGIWEGRKVDGRYNTTEPWGPFLIWHKPDGSLAAKYLGSRLGYDDREMYNLKFDGRNFDLKMKECVRTLSNCCMNWALNSKSLARESHAIIP